MGNLPRVVFFSAKDWSMPGLSDEDALLPCSEVVGLDEHGEKVFSDNPAIAKEQYYNVS